jgi:hypothetical protein
MNKALRIKINHWTLEVQILNSCSVLSHVDGDLGITQRWEFWKKDIQFLTHNFGIGSKCRYFVIKTIDFVFDLP